MEHTARKQPPKAGCREGGTPFGHPTGRLRGREPCRRYRRQIVMAKWHMASSGDAIPKLLGRLVDLAIRAILFVVGVTIAAYWCDVQPTWKLFAFMGFWAFWSRTVFGAKGEWGKPEVQPA